MRILTLLIILVFCSGCSQYRIDKNLVGKIKTQTDWYEYAPEISYIASRGSNDDIIQLAKLIPMAIKNDCTCCAGTPGDVAAIVLEKLLTIDPKLEIFKSLSTDDRKDIYRYYMAINVLDWIDIQEEIKNTYQIEY